MSSDRERSTKRAGGVGPPAGVVQRSPGKRTLVEARYGVQRRRSGQPSPAQDQHVHTAAAAGLGQPASSLPHAERIQASFGRHDVSGIEAHIGGAAATASDAIGAAAYATGDHVVFAAQPDLATAAHEAAHVVQQRAGVSLLGGIDGGKGDPYERHADEVAAAVVRGESAEALLDRHAGGGGGATAAIQRIGNEAAPEDGAIAAIHAGAATPADKLAALEASAAPELAYGVAARTDEEAEVTAGASYLQKKKTDWRAELASRGAGNAAQWQSQETFQYEMDRATPGEARDQTPWFMQPAIGYQVTGANVGHMAAVGAHRDAPAADDPQQTLGMTYQRDTMYTIGSAAIAAHKGTFGPGTTSAEAATWAGDVLRVTAAADELRVRVTGADDDGAGTVRVTGTVLAAPVSNGGIAAGTVVRLDKNGGTGVLTMNNAGGLVHTVAAGTWSGALESWAFYQSRTRINDGLGMNHPDAGRPEARNRGAGAALDDATFDQVADRYNNAADPERGYGRTLGPHRTRLNFNDDPAGPPQVGWDVGVAPYRRLGGDSIFHEAAHPAPAAYQNQLQPAAAVDVTNPAWYYNQANAMADRFVGGRSNSTALYMSSATMLYHQGRLSLADAADVIAFVIADMVVSGEHSMPECMTTVVMAAGSSEPWTATPLNLAGPADTLSAWLLMVPPAIKAGMLAEGRASLLRLLANAGHDPKMVKVLTMLVRALH